MLALLPLRRLLFSRKVLFPFSFLSRCKGRGSWLPMTVLFLVHPDDYSIRMNLFDVVGDAELVPLLVALLAKPH